MARHESTIQHCGCACPNQDNLHGPGKRVHNQTKKGRRCTGCGTEHLGGGFEGSLVPKAAKKAS